MKKGRATATVGKKNGTKSRTLPDALPKKTSKPRVAAKPAEASRQMPVKKEPAKKTPAAKPRAPKAVLPVPVPSGSRPVAQSATVTYPDIPFSYNVTKLVLLVRDPEWAYAYWDFSADTWSWIQDLLRRDGNSKAKLRLHNLDAGQFHDLEVSLEAKCWYLGLQPDTTYEAELGLLDSTGRFHVIARSNRIRMPRSGPSKNIDHAWEALDFEEIYRLSGGGRPGQGASAEALFSHFKRA